MSPGNMTEYQQTKEMSIDVTVATHADEISIETLVTILIEKGICSFDEMYLIESKIREEKAHLNHIPYIHVKNPYDRGKLSGLKRTMSKFRWSRRLGTLLFGWKWKKIKKNPALY